MHVCAYVNVPLRVELWEMVFAVGSCRLQIIIQLFLAFLFTFIIFSVFVVLFWDGIEIIHVFKNCKRNERSV